MSGRDLDLISSNANQALSAETLLGKVVLSASLREFSRRSMRVFEPEVLLLEGIVSQTTGLTRVLWPSPATQRALLGLMWRKLTWLSVTR